MPRNSTLHWMNRVHRLLLRMSGGRLGWNLGGMPVLELTTTGRKSGQPRTSLLSSPLRRGERYVVVASRGGDDTVPAWFLNLSAQSDVHVRTGRDGDSVPMSAQIANAEERAELWPRVTTAYPLYAGYQRRTAREIPLVFLTPRSSSPPVKTGSPPSPTHH